MAEELDVFRQAQEEEKRRQREQRLTQSLSVDGPDPDAAARLRTDARRLDTTPGMVAQSPLMQRTAEAQRTAESLRSNPRLAEWLAREDNAAVARDDIETLSVWEKLSEGLKTIPSDPLILVGMGRPMRRAMTQVGASWEGAGLDEERRRLYARKARATLGADTWNEDDEATLLTATRERDEAYGRGLPEGLERDIVGGVRSGVSGVVAGLRGAALGPVEALRNDEFAVVAPISGYLEESAEFSAEMEAGGAFEQFLNVRTIDGRPLDPKVAAEAATLVGAINAGIEFTSGIAFSGLSSATKGIRDQLLKEGGQAAIQRFALNDVLKRYGLDIATTAVGEGAEEVLQGLSTQVGQEYAQQRDGGAFAPTDWNAVWKDLAYQGMVGGIVGAGFGAVAGAPTLMSRETDAIDRSQASQQTLQELAKAGAASRLGERLPDAYAQAVNEMTAGTPIDTVRLAAEGFVEVFQRAGISPVEAAEKFGIGREELERALRTGGDVQIATGNYSAQVDIKNAPFAKVAEDLRQHARLRADDYTQAEMETATRRAGEQVETIRTEIEQLREGQSRTDQIVTRIRETLDRQAKEGGYTERTNRLNAEVLGRGIATLLQRSGESGKAVFDRLVIDLSAPASESPARIFGAEGVNRRTEDGSVSQRPAAPEDVDIAAAAKEIASIRRAPVREPMRLGEFAKRYARKRGIKGFRVGDDASPILDDMAQAATEEGYFPGVDRASINDLLDALNRDEREGPVYTAKDTGDAVRRSERDAAVADWIQRGVDINAPAAVQREQIARAIAKQKQAAASATPISEAARFFGTDEELRDFLALADSQATAEEVFVHPVMERIAAHVAAQADTMSPEQANDVAFWQSRRYVGEGGAEITDDEAVALLLSRAMEKAGGEVDRGWRATIVVGHPGAGKSTYIERLAASEKAAVLDADEAKRVIPEYEGGRNTQAVHKESAALRNIALKTLVSYGDNIILERVGDTPSAYDTVTPALREAGYEVRIVHVNVSGREAVRRAAHRFVATGRYIDPAVYARVFDRPKPVFDAQVEIGAENGYVEVDANGPRDTETLSFSQNPDGLDEALLGRGRGGPAVRDEPGAGRVDPPFEGEAGSGAEVAPRFLADDYLEYARELGNDGEFVEAYANALVARELGADARATIDLLEEDMDPDQMVEGEAMADDLLAERGGEVYQFLPAETADPEAYDEAQQALAAGMDAETVRRLTGVFHGPDGKARVEIDDSVAEIDEGLLRTLQSEGAAAFDAKTSIANQEIDAEILAGAINADDPEFSARARLADLVQHDELFAKAPYLADVEVIFWGGMLQHNMDGLALYRPFDGSTPSYILMPSERVSTRASLSDLMHETAHLIQLEGLFDIGGSPDDAPQYFALLDLKQQDAIRDAMKAQGLDILNDRDLYTFLAGEREAFDVQARLGLSAEQRAGTQPALMRGPVIPTHAWTETEWAEIETALEAKTQRMAASARKPDDPFSAAPTETRRTGAASTKRRTPPNQIPEPDTPEWTEAVAEARTAQQSGQRLNPTQRALLRWDSESGGEVFQAAKSSGFSGSDIGEAREWVEAVRKRLDMSLEARMARAKAERYRIDEPVYRGVTGDFMEMRPLTWVTTNPEAASAFGDRVIKMFVRYEREANMADYARARRQAASEGLEAGRPVEERAAAILIDEGFDVIRDENFKGAGGVGREAIAILRPADARSVNAAFDPDRAGEANILAQSVREPAPIFRSAVEAAITGPKAPKKGDANAWMGFLRNVPGVKKEELDWIGLEDFLKAKGGSVSQDEVAAFVQANGVRVEETVLGGDGLSAELQGQLLPLIEERDRLTNEHTSIQSAAPIDPAHGRNRLFTDEQKARLAEITKRRDEIAPEILRLQTAAERNKQGTKWSSYTLPGGENYRELLLRLPVPAMPEDARIAELDEKMNAMHASILKSDTKRAEFEALHAERTELVQQRGAKAGKPYRSSHWDESNVLAHIRFKERVDADGARVLAIEEVQSDWHQAGRERGYKVKVAPEDRALLDEVARNQNRLELQNADDLIQAYRNGYLSGLPDDLRAVVDRVLAADDATRVPDAPFKDNKWAALSLKRMIRWAAENGFDKIAWIPGQVAVERFNLSHALGDLEAEARPDGRVIFTPSNGRRDARQALQQFGEAEGGSTLMTREQAMEAFGKETGTRLFDAALIEPRTFMGEDLNVGGAGMRAFYDKILVNIANDLGKKHGARVETTRIDTTSPRLRIFPSGDTYRIGDDGFGGAAPNTPTFRTRAEAEAWVEANRNAQPLHSLPITDSMRDAAMEGQALFQQPAGETMRGATRFDFDRNGELRGAAMRLTSARNQSTLIHEGGHVFLELIHTLAMQEDAPADIIEMWESTREWMGVEPTAWASMTIDEKRPYHERWAETFEAYLREGKAPSNALAEAFQAFKAWLLDLYKSILQLDQNLTPEIRDVFDRMLATDAEIAEVRAQQGADFSLFKTREESGMSPARWDNFQRERAAARQRAQDALLADLMGVYTREKTRDFQHRRAEITRRVEREVDMAPARRALDWFSGLGWKEDVERVGKNGASLTPGWAVRLGELAQRRNIAPAINRTSSSGQNETWSWDDIEGLTPEGRAAVQAFEVEDAENDTLPDAAPKDRILDYLDYRAEGMAPGDAHDLIVTSYANIKNVATLRVQLAQLRARVRKAQAEGDLATLSGQLGVGAEELAAFEADVTPQGKGGVKETSARSIIADGLKAKQSTDRIRAKINEQRGMDGREPISDSAFQSQMTRARQAEGLPRLKRSAAETDALRPELEALWAAGRSDAQIAARYGMSSSWASALYRRWHPGADPRPTARKGGGELYQSGDEAFPPGLMFERPDGLPAMRLDLEVVRAELAAIYGEAIAAERIKALPKKIRDAAAKGEGRAVSAEEAAQWFGFGSGDELIRALETLPSRKKTIDEIVAARVRAEFGDIMDEPGALSEAALKAAHDEAQARVMEIELDALARVEGPRSRALQRATKQLAEQTLQALTLKQIDGYETYLTYERRAARNAEESLAAGKPDEAARWKQRQLISFHLYRMARDASRKAESARNHWRDLGQSETTRQNIFPDHRDQIDQILEGLEMRAVPLKELRRRASFNDWFKSMQAQGLEHMVAADPDYVALASRKPFIALTWEEFSGVKDAIDNLEHIGRRWKDALAARKQRLIEEEIVASAASANAQNPIRFERPEDESPGVVERLDQGREQLHANITRPEFIFRGMDGMRENGPTQRMMMGRVREARNDNIVRNEAANAEIERINGTYSAVEWDDILRKRMFFPFFFNKRKPGAGMNMTKEKVLSMALNWGNRYNQDTLIDGIAGDEQFRAAARQSIERVFDQVMTKRDWAYVQNIWDYNETFKPDIAAMYRDIQGIEPAWVEAQPVTTKFGELRGGYMHIDYDWGKTKFEHDKAIYDQLQNAYGGFRSSTRTVNGFTKNRVGSGFRPVLLQLDVWTNHIAEVNKDLSFRRALIDLARITNNGEFQAAYSRFAGRAAFEDLKPWLIYIAHETLAPVKGFGKVIRHFRQATPVVLMGAAVGTIVQQVTGPLTAAARIGLVPWMKSTAKNVGTFWTWPDLIRTTFDKSPFIRNQLSSFDASARDMANEMNSGRFKSGMELLMGGRPVQGVKAIGAYLQKHALYPMGMVATMMNVLVWNAAYDKATAGQVAGIDPMNDQDKIDYADSVVSMTQGSGLPENLAPIQRTDEVGKLITPMWSYFGTQYNALFNEQLPGLYNKRISPIEFMTWVFMAMAATVVADALAGRLDGEDDEEKAENLKKSLIKAGVGTVMGGIPLARDIANASAETLATGKEFDVNAVPAFGAMQSAGGAATGWINDIEDGEVDRKTVKDSVMAASYAFKLPGRQINTSTDYVYDVSQGVEDPIGDPGSIYSEGMLRDTR